METTKIASFLFFLYLIVINLVSYLKIVEVKMVKLAPGRWQQLLAAVGARYGGATSDSFKPG
jgi:hypothetical protein